MLRFAALVLLTSLPLGVRAQVPTRPVVTVSAGYLRAPDRYDRGGETSGNALPATATSVAIAAEVPIGLVSGRRVSAGAAVRAASYELEFSGGDDVSGDLRPQRLDLFGRIGTTEASARIGVSVDLGQSIYAYEGSFNSDGQHALVAQIRGETPSGRLRLFAQLDASLTLPANITVLYGSEDPRDEPTPYAVEIDNGDPYGFQVGATGPLGPVVVGLAAFYASRTAGQLEYTDGAPPGPAGFPDEPAIQPFEFGYYRVIGLVPSVTYTAPSGRLSVRAEGSFSDLYTMEGFPVGITLSGESGPVTRPAVTLSVGIEL